MAVIDHKRLETWKCVYQAPRMQANIFSVIATILVVFMGVNTIVRMDIVNPVQGANLFLSVLYTYSLSWLILYAVGIVAVVFFGIFVRNLLPERVPEVPVISWLNRRRLGRIFLMFASIVAIGFLGLDVMLLIFVVLSVQSFFDEYENMTGIRRLAPVGESGSVFY